jgi:hypothetical protein
MRGAYFKQSSSDGPKAKDVGREVLPLGHGSVMSVTQAQAACF